MIKRFKEIEGRYIEKIIGQDRFAFAHSDTNDFYDLIEWSQAGGYRGSIIIFFDFDSGNVYKPFAKKKMLFTAILFMKKAFTISCRAITMKRKSRCIAVYLEN